MIFSDFIIHRHVKRLFSLSVSGWVGYQFVNWQCMYSKLMPMTSKLLKSSKFWYPSHLASNEKNNFTLKVGENKVPYILPFSLCHSVTHSLCPSGIFLKFVPKCLYLPISLPIQLGSLWNFKLKFLCYKPIITTSLFAIRGDYPMS